MYAHILIQVTTFNGFDVKVIISKSQAKDVALNFRQYSLGPGVVNLQFTTFFPQWGCTLSTTQTAGQPTLRETNNFVWSERAHRALNPGKYETRDYAPPPPPRRADNQW